MLMSSVQRGNSVWQYHKVASGKWQTQSGPPSDRNPSPRVWSVICFAALLHVSSHYHCNQSTQEQRVDEKCILLPCSLMPPYILIIVLWLSQIVIYVTLEYGECWHLEKGFDIMESYAFWHCWRILTEEEEKFGYLLWAEPSWRSWL